METQMSVSYALEILSQSPFIRHIPVEEKIELAQQYCDQWGTPVVERENKKNQIKEKK